MLQKLTQAVNDFESGKDVSSKLQYGLQSGVGQDSGCPLQIVADSSTILAVEDIQKWENEVIFDTYRVNLFRTGSVYKALRLCKAVKQARWPLIVSTEMECCETSDTFIADFAVGVGAGQFHGGGVEGGEYMSKYNRLLEIQRNDESVAFVGKAFRVL